MDYEWTRWPIPPSAPPPSNYQVSGGIVTDTVTGLQWQQTLSTAMYTWANAKTYCVGLSLGGAGWRLPTLVELGSIVDFGRYDPAIDQTVFPSTASASFWSSSPYAFSTGSVWLVGLISGYTDKDNMAFSYHVRCVRCAGGACAVAAGGTPGAPPGRYVVSTDTVLDTVTTLTWQRNAPGATYSWTNAGTYCASLNLSGTGWRLPTVKELQSLVDIRTYGPAIDTAAFPNTQSDWFWSSSPYAGYSYAWAVSFGDGKASTLTNLTFGRQVRCVR